MGLFSSKSKTEQITNVANQQVGASEGSLAVGAGANVNIATLDAGLAEQALREIGGTAGLAIETTAATARGVTSDALSFGDSSMRNALDFASESQDRQNAQNQNLLNFARSQGELVAASRGVETPDTSKSLIYVLGAALIGGLFLAFRKKG